MGDIHQNLLKPRRLQLVDGTRFLDVNNAKKGCNRLSILH